jgi:hypothetical protein
MVVVGAVAKDQPEVILTTRRASVVQEVVESLDEQLPSPIKDIDPFLAYSILSDKDIQYPDVLLL